MRKILESFCTVNRNFKRRQLLRHSYHHELILWLFIMDFEHFLKKEQMVIWFLSHIGGSSLMRYITVTR